MWVKRKRLGGFAADATHGARCGHEVGIADVVAGFLFVNNALQPVLNLAVGGSGTEDGPQVVLYNTEQASTNLPVGREPYAIAVTTKRFANWSNDSDFSRAIVEGPSLRGRGDVLVGYREKVKTPV